MAAPKTRKTKDRQPTDRKRIQLIVFAPNDPSLDPDEHRTYMVCPPSLRVIEVVEKLGDEAEVYLELLTSKAKGKSKTGTKAAFVGEDAVADGDGAPEDEIEIQVSGSLSDDDSDEEGDSSRAMSDVQAIEEAAERSLELDDDVVAFAAGLDDIFPEDGSAGESLDDAPIGLDMEEAIALLDENDSADDVAELASAMMGDDGLPTL